MTRIAPGASEASYRGVRAATEALAESLSAEDCALQSMPDASPVKWHLAHTSWFFETFVLEAHAPGYRAFHPTFRHLFNSYYHSVGEQYARPQRGLLTRPGLDEVLAYRSHVDRHVLALLAKGPDLPEGVAGLVELGLHHEQQHQELVLTDVKHLLSLNPLRPAYRERTQEQQQDLGRRETQAPAPRATELRWHAYDAGPRSIGHDGDGFAFDNEGPRHRVEVQAFELASRPVTVGEFLAFVEDGGYERPEHWLADGWAAARARGWRAPLYWEEAGGDGARQTFTLSGSAPLCAEEPVCHVSFYEADAYARWAGERLPTEFEWEVAAAELPIAGHFVESGRLHPAPAEGGGPGPLQLFGDVWEWTRSAYAPYPGFRAATGAIGEYNGKFMCNQMVLRGGSCVTPRSHVRASYRNFFYPDARWQLSGFRLARD